MTLSAPQRPRRTWVEWFNAIEDGAILRVAFFAMLAGTVWVLLSDYRALTTQAFAPRTGHVGDPVLPAVARPEIDPANPAYRPIERITTPRAVLAAPLTMELTGGGVLELTGTIVPGSAAAFAGEVALRGDYIETVRLDSPGGSVEDALAIAAVVGERGFDTEVGAGAICASSCPLILASGAMRDVSAEGSVGVHQIYAAPLEGRPVSAAQAMSDAQMIVARIARHLKANGVNSAVWVHGLETPPDRLYYLTHEQMREYGLISAPAH